MKSKIVLFFGLVAALTACPTPVVLQDFTARYEPIVSSQNFDAVQGSSEGVNVSLCGIGAFSSGLVRVSLQNAPLGVSISKPSNLEFNLASACRTTAGALAPQLVVVSKDIQLSVAANAEIVSSRSFYIVFKSGNVTKLLDASISIKAPAPVQDFTARYEPNVATASFNVNQNGSESTNLSLCGLAGFSGKVSVALENAPVGVSISKPNPLEFDLSTACRTSAGINPQLVVTTKDMFIAVAADAPIVSNRNFNFVFRSSDVTKRLPATISISAAPVLGSQ